jgi:hypothetical protein
VSIWCRLFPHHMPDLWRKAPSGTDRRGVSALEIDARWSLDRRTVRRPWRGRRERELRHVGKPSSGMAALFGAGGSSWMGSSVSAVPGSSIIPPGSDGRSSRLSSSGGAPGERRPYACSLRNWVHVGPIRRGAGPSPPVGHRNADSAPDQAIPKFGLLAVHPGRQSITWVSFSPDNVHETGVSPGGRSGSGEEVERTRRKTWSRARSDAFVPYSREAEIDHAPGGEPEDLRQPAGEPPNPVQ